eukprot:TRINITY_DN41237_c0_g1_i2.p1 TRINITY_DN41237_c0_g1~~TRINITY_DN41237_c0_g1_i2.p1  ORF type:complete len:475 (+),score=126.20 TRINITY_DN41237_c0_g1_i2:770-2194(+)
MRRIDGDELSAEELAPIAHKCGPQAWRWRVRDLRPQPRGPLLGSLPGAGQKAVTEDPDFEDFAFFAGIDGVGTSSGSTATPPDEDVPMPPSEPAPPEPAVDRAPPPPADAAPPPPTPSPPPSERRDSRDLSAADARKEKSYAEAVAELQASMRRDREEEESRRREKENAKKRQEEEKRKAEEERRRQLLEEEERRKDAELREKRKRAESQFVSQATGGANKRTKIAFGSVGTSITPGTATPSSSSTAPAPGYEGASKAAQEIEEQLQRKAQASQAASAAIAAAMSRLVAKQEKQETQEKQEQEEKGTLAALLRAGGAGKAAKPGDSDAASGSAAGRTGSSTDASKTAQQKAPEPDSRVGWMKGGQKCSLCSKAVADRGGVMCGRLRKDGTLAGCRAAVCWRCMNRAPKDSFGKVKTTKSELASLGEEGWWMHEACMNAQDRSDYEGVEGEGDLRDDGAPAPPKKKEKEVKFAWE